VYTTYPLASYAPRQRFDAFKGLVDDVFCPMALEANRDARESFNAHVDGIALGKLQLVRVSTSPIRVARRSEDIARIPDPPFLVKFQVKGDCLWQQRGREVLMRPGDFVIASTAEPYKMQFFGDYATPVLVVAESIMRRLTPHPEQFLGVRMPGEEADCGLLSSFVAQIAARMHKLPVQMVHRVEANVLDLLGAVLGARASVHNVSHTQMLAQIKAYINSHLHDRELGPVMLARAFAISTRQVHALFEAETMTVGRYIRAQRVAACRRTLEDSTLGTVSLTEVALQWGFYDLSHMTRCFREEYGEPPRRFLLQRCNQ
jgi:AraC family transcriptional activator of tynA and feaB